MSKEFDKGYKQGQDDLYGRFNKAVAERTQAYNEKLREIKQLQAENERLKDKLIEKIIKSLSETVRRNKVKSSRQSPA